MVIPELADYIRKNKELGKSVNDIRLELLNAGWDDLDIEQSFAFVVEASQRAQTAVRMLDSDKTLGVAMTQKTILRSVLISVSFLVVVGGILAGVIYFKHDSVNTLLNKIRDQVSHWPGVGKLVFEEKLSNYTNPNLGFEINYPMSWVVSTSTEETYRLFKIGSTKEALNLPIQKNQAVVYVELAYGNFENTKKVLSYSQKFYDQYSKEVSNDIKFTYLEPEKIKLGNIDAFRVEYDVSASQPTSEIITGHIVQYVFNNPNIPHAYYKISLNTEKKSERYERNFETIVKSFAIKDTVKWKKYSDKNGVFSMDYPPLWTATYLEDDKEDGTIAIFDSPADHTGLKGVVVSVAVLPPYLFAKSSTTPLSVFVDGILKLISRNTNIAGKPIVSDMVLSGNNAKIISYSSKSSEGLPALIRQIIIKTSEKMLVITEGKNPDNSDFDLDLEKMYKSFSM
jgi:hypothetical protein